MFNFMRTCQTVFHSAFIILHPQLQYMRVLTALGLHHHLVLSFLNFSHSMDKEDVIYIYNGILLSHKKMKSWDFPGGPVVKTSPCNVGGAGSITGGGARIPHA